MKFKTTWILLALAVAALAYFFLVEQPRHTRETRETAAADDVSDIHGDDVVSLSVDRADGRLAFERSGEEWLMTEPASDRADAAAVNTLLHTALRAEIERTIETDADGLAQYGLDTPLAVVRFDTEADEDALVIDVGDFNLTKSHCYARLNGSDVVVLLPAGLRRYATRDVFEFRDKRIIQFSAAKVGRLDISSPQQSLVWFKHSPDLWRTVVDGDTIRGNKSAIGSVLSELRGMRAQAIAADGTNPADVGFSDPVGSVSIWLAPDSTQHTFVFAKTTRDTCYVMVKGQPRISRVDPTALNVFDQTVANLRDRFVMHLDMRRIGRISIEGPDILSSIIKDDNVWSYTNPELGKINQPEARKLEFLLVNLRFKEILAERVSEPAKYGLDAPKYRVAVYEADGGLMDAFETGTSIERGAEEYVTSHSTGYLGKIDTESLKTIREQFHSFLTE